MSTLRTGEEVVGHLTTDLRLTTVYLLVHPKVYWIWNHRKWCLESVPTGPGGSNEWKVKFWDGELKLVEKMLDADPRNCMYLYTVRKRRQADSNAQSTPGDTGDTFCLRCPSNGH